MVIDTLISALRRPRKAAAPVSLLPDIQELERHAENATTDRKGQYYNRAADLCYREGEYARSLFNYGKAVQSYMESGHFEAAPAVCRRMIARSPEVVRARATLAIISLGKGHLDDARRELDDYVRAAETAHQEHLAARRLRVIGDATGEAGVRYDVAEYLLRLGDELGADRVFGTVFAERNGLRRPLPDDEEHRWTRLLRVSRLGPSDLLRLDMPGLSVISA